MPAPKVSEEELLAGLLRVFQSYGYEGASLARISEATGLEKSSLYHRFPGGKDEMALALLRHVGEHFANTVLAPLRGRASLAERVAKCANALKSFYGGGRLSCVLETLSLCGGNEQIRKEVKRVYKAWRDAFAAVAREGGLSQSAAEQRAEAAISSIHGTLILARVTGDRGPFLGVLTELSDRLTLG